MATAATPQSADNAIPQTGSQGGHGGTSGSLGTRQHPNTPVRDKYLEINKELNPLGVSDVPYHPELGETTVGHPPLVEFVQTVFRDAKSWKPRDWKRTGTYKEKSVGTETLEIEQYMTPKHDQWFARYNEFKKNVHHVSWHELDYVLRQRHSYFEAEYTPDVFDYQKLLTWDVDGRVEEAAGMTNIKMELVQMHHKIPFLQHRYFTLLVLSGILTTVDNNQTTEPLGMAGQIIVVQLPVDMSKFPSNVKKLSNVLDTHVYEPRNRPKSADGEMAALTPDQQEIKGKKLVNGCYASVEQLSYFGAGAQEETASKGPIISWCMSTASDAKGIIPKAAYKYTVPDKVAKDVQYVYNYISKNRNQEGWPREPSQE